MKFSEIIAISGQSGLFKYLTQSKGGIIVESLSDKKRFPVASTARVSSLMEIAIFTEAEDMPLAKVFQIMYDQLEGKPSISHKSSTDQMVKTFGELIPTFDRDRVHASDLKKVFMWYNLLVDCGLTSFDEELEQEEEEQEKE